MEGQEGHDLQGMRRQKEGILCRVIRNQCPSRWFERQDAIGPSQYQG
jgi:hypothetical protein